MKKLVSLLLALVVLFSFGFTAVAEEEVPTITVFMSPWVSAPLPDDDVYKAWLDETYGANFVMIQAADFTTELMTRFSSGDEPDLIIGGSYSEIKSLYEEGVLLDDWNAYADRLPNTMANLTEEAKLYCSVDGKLINVPTAAGDQLWTYQIRKDWLETLGLDMPTTMDELLDVARAFTKNDPDGNGVDDTYGFSSTGNGTSLGSDLSNLLMGFGGGHTTFYLTEDGQVSHPLLDGAYKDYLDFLTTVVDEGLIDPDWYTQAWNDRKPKTYAGQYGIVWYPVEALHTETEQGRESDGAVLNWYDLLVLESGVTVGPGLLGTLRTVSATCAEDETKMEILCKLFEDTALGQENYYVLRYGVGIDNFSAKYLDNGFVYINSNDTTLTHQHNSETGNATWNWGRICCSYADNYIGGDTIEPSALAERVIELSARWYDIPQIPGEYKLLSFDPTLSEDSSNMINEFALSYIMGSDKDYDGFVQRWLDTVGNDLIADATATWQSYGLMD